MQGVLCSRLYKSLHFSRCPFIAQQVYSPLDEADELLLELALAAGLLEVVDAAEVEDDVARLPEVDLWEGTSS